MSALSSQPFWLLVTELVGATGLIGGIALLLRGWVETRLAVMRERQYALGVRQQSAVYIALREVCVGAQAQRALLMKCHNGGSQPRVGVPMKVTAVEEYASPELPSVFAEFQARLIDGPYIRSLADMPHTGVMSFDTSELEERSLLRDLYEANGVHHAEFLLVGIASREAAMYYIAVQWRDEYEDTPEQRSALRDCVSTITQQMPGRFTTGLHPAAKG